MSDWRDTNDMYWVPPKKDEKEPEAVVMEEEEQQAEDKAEVRLSDPKFIRPEDGYQPNKPCKMQVTAEYIKKTSKTKVVFNVFTSYKEKETQEYSGLEGFIKDGIAIAEMKYLPLNEDYVNDNEKADDAAYKVKFQAKHSSSKKPVESAVMELPAEAAEGETLDIQIDINPNDSESYDDKITLYSTDASKTYSQVKTIKDDKVDGDNFVDLHFTGLKKDLSYTLEVDPGEEGEPYKLFENRKYGEWMDNEQD